MITGWLVYNVSTNILHFTVNYSEFQQMVETIGQMAVGIWQWAFGLGLQHTSNMFARYCISCYRSTFNLHLTPGWWNNQPQNLKTHKNGIWHRLNWTYKKLVIQWICLYEKFHRSSVSCLFTKHLLTCGFLTIDGRENLCYPKHNSIPSKFFLHQLFV